MIFSTRAFSFSRNYVVDALVDDGARAGRALLALEAECGLGHAFDGGIDVGIGVHDDGVLAAHFEDRALDPDLAGSRGGRALVDVEANFARTGESDVAGLGMRHHRIAETRASARTEIHHAFRHAALFQQFDELGRDGGRIARRLQDDGVAAHDRSQRHAGHDRAGKIPRRNHRAHAQRNVDQRVALAGHLHRQFGPRQAQRFAGIVFAEVDGLGDIGVGLGPVLADFEDQPRAEFELALAQQIANAEEQAGALFDRRLAPARKASSAACMAGSTCSLPAFWCSPTTCEGFAGLMDLILSLVWIRLPPMIKSYSRPSWPRTFSMAARICAGIFRLGEIGKRLIYERAFMQANLWAGRSFNGCHHCTSVIASRKLLPSTTD